MKVKNPLRPHSSPNFQQTNSLQSTLCHSKTIRLQSFQTDFQFYFFTSKWSGKFDYRQSLIMNIRFSQACKIRFLVAILTHIDWIIR